MLEVEKVIAGYDGVPVLHGVDIKVDAGEAVAVIGANGAGKSTLVATLCGLKIPMSGSVRMGGRDVTRVAPHARIAHGIAVVLEGRHLFTELTVLENLRIAVATGKLQRSGTQRFSLDDIYALFPVVKERRDSVVALLSGGQQQMVAIARALLLQPDLLVMDELTTGLAPKVVKELLTVLTELRSRGMSILLVEQSVTIAAEMTDRTYVMSVGRVMQEVTRAQWPALLANDGLVKAYLHG
ncbi:MAG: ABC transporter ATP-binding protein [Comamonadaceae bacterium]|nr:MAG: ABC transporter ATP-binding protein [Comamonadaceae bacterium]